MLKIDAMSAGESRALLLRVGYGHLGCARDNHPYVVPMHYAYDSECLYFLTTEGTKTEYIAANSEVCFQVEEVTDPSYWRSVMVIGHAERITVEDELQSAIELIKERNPNLTPAINETHIGPWKRLSRVAVYRLRPERLYGRKTI